MATKDLAQGLASLGRYGDSMLVHMNPQEVAGLQALAGSHGTSMTINPDTGMPEAFNLGGVFQAALPIALGAWLGPAGAGLGGNFFNSALTAGLAVGVGAYALTGDPMAGLSAGFGAAGGYGLGSNLAGFGTAAKTPTISGISNIAEVAKSAIPTPGLDAAMGSGISSLGANAIPTPGLDSILGSTAASKVPSIAGAGVDLGKAVGTGVQLGAPDVVSRVAAPGLTGFDAAASGVKKLFEPGGIGSYADYVRSIGGSPGMDALTVASPVISGMMQPPKQFPSLLDNMPMASNYQGPYLPAPRARRMPTEQERLQMAAMGSPEFNYFSPSNPVPGYTFADGGQIQTGGIRDLYGSSDDQTNGAVLSHDGYGLGRLNTMYGTQMAAGGPVSFEAGGTIPTIGTAPSIPETGMNQGIGAPAGLDAALSNAIADPLGRVTPEAPTQSVDTLNTMAAPMQPQAGIPAAMSPAPTLQPPVLAAQGGIMSLARGGKPSSGGYLDGPGDGMSDDIPATIAGKQPARLADGEFVIPADVVSHLGNGSTKAGAKHLYKMMDRVRQARTGTKKQGRQINPSKYLKA